MFQATAASKRRSFCVTCDDFNALANHWRSGRAVPEHIRTFGEREGLKQKW